MSINLSKEKHHIVPVRYRAQNNSNMTRQLNLNSVATCPLVKEQEIFSNIMKVITTMKEDPQFLTPGDPKYYEKYRWSFYEPFGIPQYSSTDDCITRNYRTLFKRFNKRGDWQSYFRGTIGNNTILDNFFNNPPGTCAFNLFEDYSPKYKHRRQPSNLYLMTNWQLPNTINDSKDYKIHFCVKEEYALYALMKAITIMNNRAKEKTKITGIEYPSTGKILTKFRHSMYPYEDMPGVKYAEPTIVIYSYTDKAEEVKEILEEFIKAFPESDDIGLCELGKSERIPYGNIRLNKLLCFAKGDRTMKILTVSQNLFDKQNKESYGAKYTPVEKTIPSWILEMINKCKTSDEVNKRSQHFFGHNICDDKFSSITSDNKCDIQPFCYLSQTLDCLDPNTINGIEGLEPTNEYSVQGSEGSTAPVGGRKRTRRMRKKNKKSRSRR